MRKDVRLGWRPDVPDHRDILFSLAAPIKLPLSVDLSETYTVPVVDQGQLGSCTGNGIAGALVYLQEKEGTYLNYPSRLFIYYNERVLENSVNDDSGAEIRDGIKTIVSDGFCPETDWPYDISRFAVKPSDKAYTDAKKDLVKSYQRVNVDSQALMTALASGYPVIVGFAVYDSFMTSTDGNIPMPETYESLQGGHCVIVVGYNQGTQRFKFQNSWGADWGTNGFGTLPFEYLGSIDFGGDYWIVTGDTVTPPAPEPTPQPVRNGCNPFGFLLRLTK